MLLYVKLRIFPIIFVLFFQMAKAAHHSLCKDTKKCRENACFCVLFRIEKYRKVLKCRKVFFRILTSFFSYLCTCQLETGTALQATNPIDCVRGAIARCHLEISQKTKD